MIAVAGLVPEPEGQVEATGENGGGPAWVERVPAERARENRWAFPFTPGGPMAGSPFAHRSSRFPGSPAHRLPQLPHTTPPSAGRTLNSASQPARPPNSFHSCSPPQSKRTCWITHQRVPGHLITAFLYPQPSAVFCGVLAWSNPKTVLSQRSVFCFCVILERCLQLITQIRFAKTIFLVWYKM